MDYNRTRTVFIFLAKQMDFFFNHAFCTLIYDRTTINLTISFLTLVTFYDVIFDGFMTNCFRQKFINQPDVLKIEITRHESTSGVDRKPLIKFSNSLLFYILNRENKHMDIFASRAILIIGLRT